VLTWKGKASAVSQDANRGAAGAQNMTVIDKWDKEFDRGKVNKMKRLRQRGRFHPFPQMRGRHSLGWIMRLEKGASLSHR
ncbi:UBP36 hydrolase, partial [Zapornia atra]|nr:UBP36 hydrolase [Zapornia atra]